MKKRILSLFLAACLILQTIPANAFKSTIYYGDVNSDMAINMKDILAMKKYIAEYHNTIDLAATDVTADGKIDAKDLLLLKKYIARWDVLLGPPFYTIKFNTNGGSDIASLKIRQSDTPDEVPLPAKEGAIFLGWYTDSEFSNKFYAETPVLANLELYAKYAQTENQEQFADNTFTLTEQLPELSFAIASTDLAVNEEAVLSGITLENIGNSDYINLDVIGGDGNFTVKADGGFTKGASYKLTINDDTLQFKDKGPSFRACTFMIAKNEVIDIELNDDLIYIKDSELSNITAGGVAVDSLSVAVLGNTETAVTGTFIYNDAANLNPGDVLCVYENEKPTERDTTSDYSDDNIAYIEVTTISGTTVNFKGTDADKVLALPDTLPVSESQMTSYDADGSFSASTGNLDFTKFTELGLDADTTIDKGDFVVITEADNDIVYGKIESVTTSNDIVNVTFAVTSENEILTTSLDYYTKTSVDGDVMIENADVPELERQIEVQTLQSGFAKSALGYLAYASTQTDGFKKVSGVENFIMKTSDGLPVNPSDIDLEKMGIGYEGENVTVEAQIDTNTEHFNKGLRIAVRVSGEITIGVGEENEVVIELSATFVEEVKMSFNADGGAVWKLWKGFLPYISDYKMNANIDVYNFTGISVSAKISLREKDDGSIDISEELGNLMDSEDEEEITAGVQDLFAAYGDMLDNDTDYVTLFEKSLIDKKAWVDPFCIIAYAFKVDFVVNANLNLALGCNLEYMSGTRYNFWFAIKEKSAGNSSMDLIDETFAFQFYVMGHLGIRAGLQFEFAVGLFSTDMASIGLVSEVGAYLELFGYFFYEYDSVRAQGESQALTSSKMCGALYLEFGIYLDISFKAQAANEKYVYNPTLYENQWPLLYAGARMNAYDFGYDQPEENDVVVIKDVTSQELPDSIRYMDCLDLKEGDLSINEYGLNNYYYNLSNRNFTLDESTGVVTVTVPEDVRYMECDLQVTWKTQKLAFSKNDLTRTIHLVWTNLTETELAEKYDVTVRAGKNILWSTRVNRGETPVLPTQEEILKLIDYDKYIVNGLNLKYTGYTGYSNETAQPATGNQIYAFGVTEREYTLTVNGVQDKDGVTSSKQFTAKFGDSFDLSTLMSTGTKIAGENYTKYFKTECSSESGRLATDRIDSAFAGQLLNGTYNYTAKYVDNSCIVTYLFGTYDHMALGTVTEKVEKESVPVFDYSEYVLNQGEGYIVKSWDNTIGKVSTDTTFTALCIKPTGEKHTISFETNGGSNISPVLRYEGASISPPSEPVKTGYTFTGWYSDEQLMQIYTFGKMSGEGFTLYAGWSANTYTVTFETDGGACDTLTKSVTYNETYGALPVPIKSGNVFTGWYTALLGGDLVEETVTVKTTQNQTLYAHWSEKTTVTGVDTSVQTTTYNTNPQAFEIKGNNLDGFIVKYKKAGDSDWNLSVVNSGAYAVMITRPEDDTYKSFEKTLTDTFIINKASRTISAPTAVISTTFTSIAVNVPETIGDGTVEYGVNRYDSAPSEGWSDSGANNLAPNTDYYVFTRIVGGANYLDATSTNGLFATTSPIPTGNWADFYDQTWYNSYNDINKNYTISSAAEMAAFSKLVLAGKTFSGMTVTLMGDIDLSAHLWTPIGKALIDFGFGSDINIYSHSSFDGTFEGNNKTISGVCFIKEMYYNTYDDYAIGLFSCIRRATIKNTTIKNSYIQGDDYVGGIVGYSEQSNIENCNNYGTVIGRTAVGGIAGYATSSYSPKSTITNCDNYGLIKATENIGGIVGQNECDVNGCGNTGIIISESTHYGMFDIDTGNIGGIVGSNEDGLVSNCYNTSDIKGWFHIGGIIGTTNASVTNCYNTGDINAEQYYAGGIVGSTEGRIYTTNITVTNCYNMGKITTPTNPGRAAIAGGQSVNSIVYCYDYSGSGSVYSKTEQTIAFNRNMSITGTGAYGGKPSLVDALNAWVTDNNGYYEWIIDPILDCPVFK